jgi:NAD(P)-dependent dehydrogenase (short-subunit alcohol dehydrogenase family)
MEKRKTALITGCSTGIGFETVLLLARRGYRVFAAMRDMRKAAPLKNAAEGLPVELIPLDVDKPVQVQKAVSFILKKTGRIDTLVNNAGWGAFGAIEEFTDEEIRAQYETNVFGLLRVTRAVLPAMRTQGSGRILHIGSLAGKMTFAGIGLYCSTKFAVEAITESLRLEVRPFNIQVAVVEPGSIKTHFKANRRKAHVFDQGRSNYQKALEAIMGQANQSSPHAPGPEKVAAVVAKALQAHRMDTRYPVGLDSVWLPFIRWFMPDFLYDLVLKIRYDRFKGKTA